MISALAGDAGAGGVPFALAADHVVAREDAVLNPYYRHMGGLYGSEYWTYLLPRRVGAEMTVRLTSPPFEAVGTRRAVEIGLLDDAFGDTAHSFRAHVRRIAEHLARNPDMPHLLDEKRRARRRDERIKPLSAYRAEELARSHDSASSARTAATTRPDTGSFTSSAHRARSRRCEQPRRRSVAWHRSQTPPRRAADAGGMRDYWRVWPTWAARARPRR